MSIRGGAATAYGILYQILGSIDRASSLFVRGIEEGGDLTEATLVLEPRNGGDLTYGTTVEQWKSRRSGDEWTIREIIQKVMPDLFKATDDDTLNENRSYHFVTDGACADWSVARDFFSRLKNRSIPDDPLAALDDTTPLLFFSRPGSACTERQFLKLVAAAVCPSEPLGEQNVDDCRVYRRLWHLLAGFSITPALAIEELETRIESFLRRFVDYPNDDLPSKREQVCGIVLKLATRQGTRMRLADFFDRAQLSLKDLRNWRSVFAELRTLAQADLQTKFRYHPGLDVRPCSPPHNGIVVVAGKSGQGKTWRLAAIGNSQLDNEMILVVARATGTAKQTLQSAADFVWKRGFDRQKELSLDGVANSLRRCNHDIPKVWLTLLVDDVRSYEEARELTEFPWDHYGVRLAMAVANELTERLKAEYPNVSAEDIGDFTSGELREYLRRRNVIWGELPEDIRYVLLRPLLAHLYCEVAKDGTWESPNEYALYHTAWRKVATAVNLTEHRDDQDRLRALVTSTLKGERCYPWTIIDCDSVGMDSGAIQRLVDIGWLERDLGQIRIWHSRLLNWAVAEALASEFFRRGAQALGLIKSVLQPADKTERPFAPDELRYLVMDLLWLVCDPDAGRLRDAHLVLELVHETHFKHPFGEHELFEELLPTLGERIVEVIANFLQSQQSPRAFNIANCANGLRVVGKKSPAVVTACALRMQNSAILSMRVAAARVFCTLPSVVALDALWRLYRDLVTTLSNKDCEDLSTYIRYSYQALINCAVLSPEWVCAEVEACRANPKLLNVLALALARIEVPNAESFWAKAKVVLLSSCANGDSSVARCIDRFNDRECRDYLARWSRSDNTMLASSSFDALAAIDPECAVSLLGTIDLRWSRLMPTLWLPLLLAHDRDGTLRALQRIMSQSTTHAAEYASYFFSRVDYLDAHTLRLIFESVRLLLVLNKTNEQPESKVGLKTLLQLISQVRAPSLVAEFVAMRDSELEELLVKSLNTWLTASYEYESEITASIHILLRIQGSGFARAVNQLLRSSRNSVCAEGLEWAVMQPDSDTRDILREIATGKRVGDGKLPPNEVLFTDAQELLALLGESESLIESLLTSEGDILKLADLCDQLPPMTDDVVAPVIAALASDSVEKRTLALMAIGVTRRLDLIAQCHDKLQVDFSSDRIVKAALLGLAGLKANDNQSVEYFVKYLPSKHGKLVAANGLLRSKREDARMKMLQHLEFSFTDEPFGIDERLAIALASYPDTKERAARLLRQVVESVSGFRNMFRSNEYLVLFGEMQIGNLSEILHAESNPAEGNSHTVGRRAAAIRGLSKQDPVAAFDSALRALVQGKHDREMFPQQLIEIDARRAVAYLLDQFLVENHLLVRRSIGLALRHSNERQLIEATIDSWFDNGSVDQRQAAAQIAGWIGPPSLSAKMAANLFEERSETVRHAMSYAMLEQDRQRIALELQQRARTTQALEQWCYVVSLFKLVDARMLGSRQDPLWMSPVCDDLPPKCEHYIDEQYRKELKRVSDDLKNRTRTTS